MASCNAIDTKSVLYMIVYFLMIIAFSYFYATIQFNPIEICQQPQEERRLHPRLPSRQAHQLSSFTKVLNKITLFGAIYLGIVAIAASDHRQDHQPSAALAIGGTSVIIVVGVALETVKALESQMLMRQYKGFLE